MNKDAAIKVQASTPVELPKSCSKYSTVANDNESGNGLHKHLYNPSPYALALARAQILDV